ncbi:hypothetical protein NDU88_001538 [Pleurodeles waltl]|uniref:Uncharacterized protein n=1 Tax=Pleurodeles waltl TaxID=8319 RepID=A0AAV7TIZ9_PLEWA|nr:hypothetical protein NDU88_001538 [Pleurodeles waltl]
MTAIRASCGEVLYERKRGAEIRHGGRAELRTCPLGSAAGRRVQKKYLDSAGSGCFTSTRPAQFLGQLPL